MNMLNEVSVNANARVERGEKSYGIVSYRFRDSSDNWVYAFAANVPAFIGKHIRSVAGLKAMSCREDYLIEHANEYDIKSRKLLINAFVEAK